MRDNQLQLAHQNLLKRYAMFASHMLTLTMVDSVSSASAISSVRYFIQKLNYEIYGRRSRKIKTKAKCQIIAIPVIEGLNSSKRTHAHIVLGNIPQANWQHLEQMIRNIWGKTLGSKERMCLEPLHDIDGASFYLAKEVGYINNDAIEWDIASIPSVLHTPPKRQCVEEARRQLELQASASIS